MNSYILSDYERISEEMKMRGIKGKRILVTGATGMIGSFIVRSFLYAEEKYGLENTVVALCRNRAKMLEVAEEFADSPDLEIRICDDISSFDGKFLVDYIIHTACNTNSSRMVECPVETIDGIYAGTKAVLEYARKVNAEKVLFLSSMEVYGVVDQKVILDEDSTLGHLSPNDVRSCYPMAKRLSENICVAYESEYGVPAVVLRLAQTFGVVTKPDTRYFYQLITSAKEKKDIVLHTLGDKMNNFCYLADAVRAIVVLLASGTDGGIYNVSDKDSSCTIKEMATLVADDIMDGEIKVVVDMDDKAAARYSKSTKFMMDSGKLERLGWKAEVHLKDALIRNIEYQSSLE